MNKIFVLQHTHELSDNSEDVKFIGIYSTKKKAEEAIDRLKIKPGFRETIDNFTIDQYLIDKDHWEDGFKTIK